MSGDSSGHASLWHHHDFLKLWAGETVSLFGSQVTLLALPLAAVLTLHASPVQMAILASAGRLPNLLVSLPSGIWVDRLRRRQVMIVGDLGQAFLLITIPAAALLGILSLGQIYAVAFLASSLGVVFGNAYQAYLPSLVETRLLTEANSRLEASRSLSQIAGPGLAGLLVQVLTAPIAMVVDGVSFLVSAVSLALVRHREALVTRADAKAGLWSESLAGVQFVLHHPVVRPVIGAVGASNLFLSATAAVDILFMTHQLHLGPATIGALFGLFGVGGLVGVLVAPRVGRWIGMGPAIILGGTLYGLGALATPLAGGSQAQIAVTVAVGHILMGLSAPSYYINFQSIEQAVTPPDLCGRVFAATGTVILGTAPIGALIGGVVAQLIGIRPVMVAAGLAVMLSFGLLCFTPVRPLRAIPVQDAM